MSTVREYTIYLKGHDGIAVANASGRGSSARVAINRALERMGDKLVESTVEKAAVGSKDRYVTIVLRAGGHDA